MQSAEIFAVNPCWISSGDGRSFDLSRQVQVSNRLYLPVATTAVNPRVAVFDGIMTATERVISNPPGLFLGRQTRVMKKSLRDSMVILLLRVALMPWSPVLALQYTATVLRSL